MSVAAHNDFTRTLLLWSAPLIVAHFFAVLWHLRLLVTVQPGTPAFLPPLLICINIIPIAGLFVFARGFPVLAGSMVTLPLGVALVSGAYAHFLTSGRDNVLHMPPGPYRFSFQASAISLVVLEAAGCWAGLRMLVSGGRSAKRRA